eukprot:jgi/Mesvir1/741/Mv17343-RA.3
MQWVVHTDRARGEVPGEDPGAATVPLACPGGCGHVIGTLRCQPDAERLLAAVSLLAAASSHRYHDGATVDGATPALSLASAAAARHGGGAAGVPVGRSLEERGSQVPWDTAQPLDVGTGRGGSALGGMSPMACDNDLNEGGEGAATGAGQPKKREKKRRGEGVFDFSRYATRHIAMEVAYIGTRYHGFASQGTTHPTVEGCLFDALERTRLVEGRDALQNYSRCGRTDRGVHAAGQVISLRVRSKRRSRTHPPERMGDGGAVAPSEAAAGTSGAEQGAGVGDDRDRSGAGKNKDVVICDSHADISNGVGDGGGEGDEIDYVTTMNRALPADIRVIGWCPVPDDFSARFSCRTRRYKYFFHADGLDVERMRAAASRLVGEHDFRNFCKMDAANVHSYGRTIHSFDIVPVSWFPRSLSGAGFFAMDILGSAFLWHQVRCMAAVLFLVGAGKEQPEVVDALLDITRTPRKPQYELAPAAPLVLFSCSFDGLPLGADGQRHDRVATQALRATLVEQLIGCCVTGGMLHRLLPPDGYGEDQATAASEGEGALDSRPAASPQVKGPKYVPLLKRHTEESYDERRLKLASKAVLCPSP